MYNVPQYDRMHQITVYLVGWGGDQCKSDSFPSASALSPNARMTTTSLLSARIASILTQDASTSARICMWLRSEHVAHSLSSPRCILPPSSPFSLLVLLHSLTHPHTINSSLASASPSHTPPSVVDGAHSIATGACSLSRVSTKSLRPYRFIRDQCYEFVYDKFVR
jgi:hypothetical protein